MPGPALQLGSFFLARRTRRRPAGESASGKKRLRPRGATPTVPRFCLVPRLDVEDLGGGGARSTSLVELARTAPGRDRRTMHRTVSCGTAGNTARTRQPAPRASSQIAASWSKSSRQNHPSCRKPRRSGPRGSHRSSPSASAVRAGYPDRLEAGHAPRRLDHLEVDPAPEHADKNSAAARASRLRAGVPGGPASTRSSASTRPRSAAAPRRSGRPSAAGQGTPRKRASRPREQRGSLGVVDMADLLASVSLLFAAEARSLRLTSSPASPPSPAPATSAAARCARRSPGRSRWRSPPAAARSAPRRRRARRRVAGWHLDDDRVDHRQVEAVGMR